MFYERKIKYLDYLVKDERYGNAGFVKLEARDKACNLTIHVNGLKSTDSFRTGVYLVGNGQEGELCSLEIMRGKGLARITGESLDNLGHTGIGYDALEAIRIPISTEREIFGILWERSEKKAVQNNSEENNGADAGDIHAENSGMDMANIYTENSGMDTANIYTENSGMDTGKSYAENNGIETVHSHAENNGVEPECNVAMNEGSGTAQGEEEISINPVESAEMKTDDKKGNEEDNKEVSEKKPLSLQEDKWKQLWSIYPKISPFEDEREYLSISPNDFVLLSQKYYRLVNNSFLLHGYYNYKHLILKRMEIHNEVRFYVGVPGNLFDREKQVAVMFGFEGFECLEEPARTGDYGYYLIRVEI